MTPDMTAESHTRKEQLVQLISRAIGTVRFDSSAGIPNIDALVSIALEAERDMMLKWFKTEITKIPPERIVQFADGLDESTNQASRDAHLM